MTADQAGVTKGPLPPVAIHKQFLAPVDHAAMLDWALSNEPSFKASRLFGDEVDPGKRSSRSLRDLGPLRSILEGELAAHAPEIFHRTGTRPFEIAQYELEMVAYGDGAHFAAHTDIPIGTAHRDHGARFGGFDRLLSGVYYFHAEPKGFTGGELRLFRFGSEAADGPEDWMDVPPEQNSLVVFPSWARHQVLPVSCPSNAFNDSRFAVNCWMCRGR
jgi:Rps23 Pro-64 3,4-dihydroxylase Tpa1-like proline 4-hydroxylase